MDSIEYGWDAVDDAAETARAIAWDGCHKIYLAMDDEQVRKFQSLGYGEEDSYLIVNAPASVIRFTLREWYKESCDLRLVDAVRTVDTNPNDGFTSLIPQFWEDEYEDEDE